MYLLYYNSLVINLASCHFQTLDPLSFRNCLASLASSKKFGFTFEASTELYPEVSLLLKSLRFHMSLCYLKGWEVTGMAVQMIIYML